MSVCDVVLVTPQTDYTATCTLDAEVQVVIESCVQGPPGPPGLSAIPSVVLPASEALDIGDIVNIHNVSTSSNARKAKATDIAYYACGFVTEDVAQGNDATVYLIGLNTSAAGMTTGIQFLSTVPGKTSLIAPTEPGQIIQVVGSASSATVISVNCQAPYQLR